MEFRSFYILVVVIPYLIYLIGRYFFTKKTDMKCYLLPDTSKYKLQILDIQFAKDSKIVPEDSDYQTSWAFGGYGGAIPKFFYVPKEVKLQNENGEIFNVYASIDFEDPHFHKFKRVRWKPPLESLVNNN